MEDRFFGNAEITSHLSYIRQHGGKAHKRHMTYMLIEAALGSGHLVTTESYKLRLGVALLNLRHERSRVFISRRFACYEKIFHPRVGLLLREHHYFKHIA